VTAGVLVAVGVDVAVSVGVSVGMANAVAVSPAEKVATASVWICATVKVGVNSSAPDPQATSRRLAVKETAIGRSESMCGFIEHPLRDKRRFYPVMTVVGEQEARAGDDRIRNCHGLIPTSNRWVAHWG